MIATPITGDKEWNVIFNEGTHWRIGIYRPKYTRAQDILELEQHSCPESFLLIEGEITMLFKNKNGEIAEKPLDKHSLITMTGPHAGFSPRSDGMALVVENAIFETIYTSRDSGEETRRVQVNAPSEIASK